ncbi:YNFM family putative membrane transporter [Rhizobium mesoamericanum]|uniref:MFS transporter n=1 Tax=Rhizobium mesoamericanum TaxID=1079800 RepID=UPI0027860348|nr:MFS transporter [Rhizobium mesoamericanum]MDQ0563157.1 YNFM family putative membrane transporter [Rhizobium mesoamericanum]
MQRAADKPLDVSEIHPRPNLHLLRRTAELQDKQFLLRGTSSHRRASLALFLSGFATFSLLYCVQPLMPIFAADFAVSPAASSLSLSLSTGFLAFAIFCAAAVSESFGRRSLMFVSLLGASLCTIACALVPSWHALLVIRALEGLLLGGVPAVAMAYLSEEIEPRGLGASMGLYIAGNAFGGMAGRVVTGMLAEFSSWRIALGSLGVLGLAAAIGFVLLLPASRNFAPSKVFDARFHLRAWVGHISNPALPLLFAISFLAMGSFVTVYNYIGFRLVQPPYNLNQTELGLIFAAYLFGIAASWIAGLLGDRIGHFIVLPAGIAIAAAGVAVTLSSALPLVVLGIVLLTSGFFIAHSVASALVGRLALATKGHASALYLLSYYIGSSVAGSVGGYFWGADRWNGVVAFTLSLLAIGMIAALAAAMLAKRRRRS